MKKIVFVTAVLLMGAMDGFAGSDVNFLWSKGNEFYAQKQYDSAAYYFEQIAAMKPQNAEVYYNLGNTYYRLNRVGPSVLNFERALYIKPGYKEAKDNLQLAQSRISNRIHTAGDIFFIEWWQALTRPDRAKAWAVWTLVAFSLVIVSLLIRHFQKDKMLLPSQVPGVLGFTCICLLALAYASGRNMQRHTGAVVMQNDTPLMNNEQKGKPLALVPEGTSVKIREEKGAWMEVTLPDGRSGWVQQSLVAKI
jgi:hypothetical protein